MDCYKPLTAFRTAHGEVVWAERGDVVRTLSLPCGQCIGCRLERSRQWAVRVMHESQMHDDSCFVTLTYEDAPQGLVYSDFQKFIKRLRRMVSPVRVRFFACGEYGDGGRPHFHCAIFGYAFRSDRVHFKNTGGGFGVDRSPALERLWPFGFSSVGELTFESAAYIARYVTKKISVSDRSHPEWLRAWREKYERVDRDTGVISNIEPEFVHMSLKPGIGATWFEKFGSEVFPLDRVVMRGVPMKPPRFYDVLFGRTDRPVLQEIKAARVERAVARGDQSPERLAVKEQVTSARLKLLKREL